MHKKCQTKQPPSAGENGQSKPEPIDHPLSKNYPCLLPSSFDYVSFV